VSRRPLACILGHFVRSREESLIREVGCDVLQDGALPGDRPMHEIQLCEGFVRKSQGLLQSVAIPWLG